VSDASDDYTPSPGAPGSAPQTAAQGQVINVPVAVQGSLNSAEAIAKKYNISVGQLLAANGGVIKPGTQINVPVAIQGGKTYQSLAQQFNESAAHIQSNNPNAALVAAPIPGTTGGQLTPSEQSLEKNLSGANRDAYTALTDLFSSYGLASLAPDILNYVQQGYSSDTISIMLQSTPAYQARFAGNAERVKNGLGVLSPADYISLEDSYQQVVQSAGLPAGFYDSPSDWVQWIGNNVSPSEVSTRVQMAQTATEQAPQDLVNALGQMGVPTSSIVAYMLDDKQALPILQTQFNAAQIGASALRNGLAMDPTRATTFANMGITLSQANSVYQTIGEQLPTLQDLGTIYANQSGHTTPFTQQTMENNLFMGSGQAELQQQQLVDTEKATFSGTSGVTNTSVSTAPPSTGGGKY